MPDPLPKPLLDLCANLEQRGISTWNHGEGLLDDLRHGHVNLSTGSEPLPTRSLLCTAEPEAVLAALPTAVVTAGEARRVTLATASGPVDLLPVGRGKLEDRLLEFGLSPLAFAFRPADGLWCDPIDARSAFENGILDITTSVPNPFCVAPRRYWIAARLLSQYALEPAPALLEAARAAMPEMLEQMPLGAAARREISRILLSPAPERGSAFLRESGVSAAFFPGMNPASEAIISSLRPLPSLRWAAWLSGSAIQRSMVRLRMPAQLARRIELVHRSHPIDRSLDTLREVGVRRLLSRLDEEEIDGLFAWRRLELVAKPQTEEARTRSKRLDQVEARLREARGNRERSGQVRALALDGKEVMLALGAGPGPHVGRALAHLATFVEAHPHSNEREALERELRAWAEKNSNAIR